MISTGQSVPLRPLGLGEILDRAITIYVRNIVQFSLIGAAVIVPIAVLQYALGASDASSWTNMIAAIQHPGQTPPAAASASPGLAFAVIGLSMLLTPFATIAVGCCVAAIYGGEAPDWRRGYGLALRRVPAVLGMLLCGLALLIAVGFVGGIGFGMMIGIAAVAIRALPLVGVIFGIIALIFGIAWFLSFVLVYVAISFGYYAVGMEQMSVGDAINSGLRRVVNRREMWRAVLFSLACMVLYFVLFVIQITFAGLLIGMLHAAVLYTIANALVSLGAFCFFAAAMAVYYFDVRVRAEGLDLETDLQKMETSAAT